MVYTIIKRNDTIQSIFNSVLYLRHVKVNNKAMMLLIFLVKQGGILPNRELLGEHTNHFS